MRMKICIVIADSFFAIIITVKTAVIRDDINSERTPFLKIYFIYFIFGCVGSSLLCAGFLWLWRAGATLRCGVQVSHCSGFSCCGARALGAWASVVVAHGLSSCGTRALERRLSSCGARAQLLCGMWDVGSSRARARTHVPCIGRRILNHCATREAPRKSTFLSVVFPYSVSSGSVPNYV